MELVKEVNQVEEVNTVDPVQDVKLQLEAVLSNPAIKEQAVINAKFFEEKFNGNWFSIEQVIKKTKMKGVQQVHDLLNLLCLFQLCYREDKGGIIKYKITLNPEARKMLLVQELNETREKVKYLENEISKINLKD